MSEEEKSLLNEDQWADFTALLVRRGLSDALGYLLVAVAFAMQGKEPYYVDWAELGREDRAAEIVKSRRAHGRQGVEADGA